MTRIPVTIETDWLIHKTFRGGHDYEQIISQTLQLDDGEKRSVCLLDIEGVRSNVLLFMVLLTEEVISVIPEHVEEHVGDGNRYRLITGRVIDLAIGNAPEHSLRGK